MSITHDSGEDVEQLRSIRQEMADAEKAQDPTVQAGYMDDEFILYPPMSEPMGAEEFAAALEDLYATHQNAAEYDSDGILVSGDIAVDSGTCTVTKVDEPDRQRSANYLVVYKRTDDGWKMVRDMWNWHDDEPLSA